MMPTIAILGRPNVGKSTIFNRLLRRSQAITHDMPGVTRDRIVGKANIGKARFWLVDTGGMVFEPGTGPEASRDFDVEVFEQAREALEECQAVLIVVDGREGLTPVDQQVADLVRKSGRPALVAVNKVDGEENETEALSEFHGLGMELFPVSAAHGHNLRPFRERVEEMALALGAGEDEALDQSSDREEQGLRLAVLGRPNAGKSSLVNRITGSNRLIVSDVPGTTRDAVDVTFEARGKRYTFVDTAGVRRRANIREQLEKFTVIRALRSAQRADVAVMVVDCDEGVARQDKRLLEFLVRERTPFLVALNKVDLVDKERIRQVKEAVDMELRIAPHVPKIYISAKSGRGVKDVLPLAEEIRAECGVRVGTGELNRAFGQVMERHQPPMVGRRRAKFYYMTQADADVPTFVFFVNDKGLVKPAYARYLENQLRRMFGITKAPVDVVFRSSHAESKPAGKGGGKPGRKPGGKSGGKTGAKPGPRPGAKAGVRLAGPGARKGKKRGRS